MQDMNIFLLSKLNLNLELIVPEGWFAEDDVQELLALKKTSIITKSGLLNNLLNITTLLMQLV